MADERPSASSRIDYFDYLRVVALTAVLVRHTASQNWYDIDVNGAVWRCFNVYCSLTQYCVPIFVMISGALFLGKEIPVRQIYSKYVLRMAAAFCFLMSSRDTPKRIGCVSWSMNHAQQFMMRIAKLTPSG